MAAIDTFNLFERIDQCIRMKATGTSFEFADRLGISRSKLMEHLREMREWGAEIAYDHYRGTYYYEREGQFFIGFLAPSMNKIKGGTKILGDFRGVRYFWTPAF